MTDATDSRCMFQVSNHSVKSPKDNAIYNKSSDPLQMLKSSLEKTDFRCFNVSNAPFVPTGRWNRRRIMPCLDILTADMLPDVVEVILKFLSASPQAF
jgi:hypothetical protein